MNLRWIVVSLVAMGIGCTAATMEQGAPKSTPATRYSGIEVPPAPVGVIPDVRLRDNERTKDLELTIDYPTRGGSYPLIVLSPGYGGSHRAYVGLSSYWAGNNYVVIRLNHADDMANVKSADDVWANATPADWRNRVRDVTFVLDSLPTLIKSFPELEGKIDETKIGVAGHGYGAHTAMLVAGARTFPGGVSYADPRVKAVVAMSPQGPSEQRGLTSESFAGLTIPAMFMTGTLDRGTVESETPEWRSEAFRLSSAGDKWLVNVTGAHAATFAGGAPSIEQIARERGMNDRGVSMPVAPDPDDPSSLPGMAPTGRDVMREGPAGPRSSRTEVLALRQKELFGTIRGIALTFFDAYLEEDAEGRAALAKAAERPNVTVEKK